MIDSVERISFLAIKTKDVVRCRRVKGEVAHLFPCLSIQKQAADLHIGTVPRSPVNRMQSDGNQAIRVNNPDSVCARIGLLELQLSLFFAGLIEDQHVISLKEIKAAIRARNHVLFQRLPSQRLEIYLLLIRVQVLTQFPDELPGIGKDSGIALPRRVEGVGPVRNIRAAITTGIDNARIGDGESLDRSALRYIEGDSPSRPPIAGDSHQLVRFEVSEKQKQLSFRGHIPAYLCLGIGLRRERVNEMAGAVMTDFSSGPVSVTLVLASKYTLPDASHRVFPLDPNAGTVETTVLLAESMRGGEAAGASAAGGIAWERATGTERSEMPVRMPVRRCFTSYLSFISSREK